MNRIAPVENGEPLFPLLIFTTIMLILGCSPKSTSQTSNLEAKDNSKHSLTVQDPYSGNREWAAYRESIGMFALHLKPSEDILQKKYEIKEEEFLAGKKKGELVFNADKLGILQDGIFDDSCLHFYSFKNDDSAYQFQFNPERFNSLGIYLSTEKENSRIYHWVALYEDSKKVFYLKDNEWKPIFSLTLPYKELCTPEECFYCVLPENVNHYQDWGKTMKIKHYYIFSIRVL